MCVIRTSETIAVDSTFDLVRFWVVPTSIVGTIPTSILGTIPNYPYFDSVHHTYFDSGHRIDL